MTTRGLPPLFGAPWEGDEEGKTAEAWARKAAGESAYSARMKASREKMTRPGLPPLIGAPWERQEPDPGTRHGMTFSLTFEGKRLLGRLYREVQWDDMGMAQVAGTAEDAEVLRVLEAVAEGTLQGYLDCPGVGPIVRRRVIGLFEAGYVKSHSLRDI